MCLYDKEKVSRALIHVCSSSFSSSSCFSYDDDANDNVSVIVNKGREHFL